MRKPISQLILQAHVHTQSQLTDSYGPIQWPGYCRRYFTDSGLQLCWQKPSWRHFRTPPEASWIGGAFSSATWQRFVQKGWLVLAISSLKSVVMATPDSINKPWLITQAGLPGVPPKYKVHLLLPPNQTAQNPYTNPGLTLAVVQPGTHYFT